MVLYRTQNKCSKQKPRSFQRQGNSTVLVWRRQAYVFGQESIRRVSIGYTFPPPRSMYVWRFSLGSSTRWGRHKWHSSRSRTKVCQEASDTTESNKLGVRALGPDVTSDKHLACSSFSFRVFHPGVKHSPAWNEGTPWASLNAQPDTQSATTAPCVWPPVLLCSTAGPAAQIPQVSDEDPPGLHWSSPSHTGERWPGKSSGQIPPWWKAPTKADKLQAETIILICKTLIHAQKHELLGVTLPPSPPTHTHLIPSPVSSHFRGRYGHLPGHCLRNAGQWSRLSVRHPESLKAQPWNGMHKNKAKIPRNDSRNKTSPWRSLDHTAWGDTLLHLYYCGFRSVSQLPFHPVVLAATEGCGPGDLLFH